VEGDRSRIIGLSLNRPAVAGGVARVSGLWDAIGRRYELIEIMRPEVEGARHWANTARHVHRHRRPWSHRASMNAARFGWRTAIAEDMLRAREGGFDVVLQWQTLFAPGDARRLRPTAIYTDNIYALTHRIYPRWSALSKREAGRFLALERETLLGAGAVFAMSQWLKDGMIDAYGIPPERIEVVGSSGNLKLPDLPETAHQREAVLFVGLAWELKGGETLLAAWPKVRRERPHAELWIVGASPPKRSAADGVRWLGLIADPAELSARFLDARVFVLPSLFDARPHVVSEAQAHGLPSVVSDRCSLPELVHDGVTGRVVPAADPDALADALVELLADEEGAQAMGRAARTEAEQAGSWDAVVARMAPRLTALAAAEGHRLCGS